MSSVVPDSLDDQPPSVKLVYYVLRADGEWLSISDITEETRLKQSTTHWALRRLDEEGVIEYRSVVHDVRKREYRLC